MKPTTKIHVLEGEKTILKKTKMEGKVVGAGSQNPNLMALPTQGKKDIVFRFMIEYRRSLRDFYRPLGSISRSILI